VPLPEGAGQIVYLIGSADEGTLDLMVQSVADVATPPSGVLTGTGGLVDTGGTQVRWPIVLLALLLPSAVWALLRRGREAASP
jgi:hypothetical protein